MKKSTFPRTRLNLVPAMMVSGHTLMIAAGLIPQELRKVHHGQTAAGVQVNSPETYQVSDKTTIVWSANGAPGVAFNNDDLEVLSTQFLATRGLSVQPAVQQA